MTAYAAPLQDLRFVLDEVVGFGKVAELPGYEAATPDLVEAVLGEAGKLASEVLAPLNAVGDREGSVLENGVVRTPKGFREAYRQYIDSGWNSLPFDADFGGQGLPWTLAFAVQEMWQSANMSFALCPLLTQGAVELLTAHGTPEQRDLYLSKLISGEWTGTMNLTEPQAGSDVGAVRTRAVKDGARYRISGQKIFITYGDHDLTENVIHMVLARTPDAPSGTKGLSLFLVPKVLVNPDGSLGVRNDVRVVSLEHKLGIHASPTAVMAFGDTEGAIGYLVGEENRGIEAMFTMMNNARLNVGSQGVAIAERAYQQARDYAKTRIQSRPLSGKGEPVAIIQHPDVRRMLMTMKAQVEAGRALVLSAGVALDMAKNASDPDVRAKAQERVDLLTPVTKAWCTDMGVEVASIGIQVHGGMGYIEETGAAQHLRDARITPIYEGTNGIQANDLVFRKVARDSGAAAYALFNEIRDTVAAASALPGDDMEVIAGALDDSIDALEAATDWIIETASNDPVSVASAASPYLRLFATVTGGWLMTKAAIAAQNQLSSPGSDAAFCEAKLITTRFYAEQILSQAYALVHPIMTSRQSVMALAKEQF